MISFYKDGFFLFVLECITVTFFKYGLQIRDICVGRFYKAHYCA